MGKWFQEFWETLHLMVKIIQFLGHGKKPYLRRSNPKFWKTSKWLKFAKCIQLLQEKKKYFHILKSTPIRKIIVGVSIFGNKWKSDLMLTFSVSVHISSIIFFNIDQLWLKKVLTISNLIYTYKKIKYD